MKDAAIEVKGIGKQYEIGQQQSGSDRLAEALIDALRGNFSRRRWRESPASFWALRDVSFDVKQGDVVGVIGRNGSGKSTLLKILSRITEPTTGTATLRGRVGSLLEVGTGFHPELSGRENIFMSGAVLGMRRAEILRKFDEIVDFSGVETFIDTPVKRYSSGMQVRLGFAVAAHLDPDVLFVDEVLAVGDAEFQRKSLGKMSELGEGGRTILFVSHSMPSVLRLCRSAVLLDAGRVTASGPTSEVVRTYLETHVGSTSERHWDAETAPGDDVAKLRSVQVSPASGGPGDEIDIREPVLIQVEYWRARPTGRRPFLNVDAFNEEGICIFALTDELGSGWDDLPAKPGLIRSTCRIPGNFLAEGRVTLNVAVVTQSPRIGHAVRLDVVSFLVVDRSDGDGARGTFTGTWPGVVRPLLEWAVEWLPG